MSSSLNIYRYWDKGGWVNIFFNTNRDVEMEWENYIKNEIEPGNVPTKLAYDIFISRMKKKGLIKPD